MKKPKLPKKGAGRRLSERLTNLSKQPPPQSLVDKINADQDGATKEQKAQDWVVANVDSAPDTPSFEEVWIAGYEQGDRDAVERSMTHIEKQGVALANTEHELGLFKKENSRIQEQVYTYIHEIEEQAKEIERLRSALSVIKTSDNLSLSQRVAADVLNGLE